MTIDMVAIEYNPSKVTVSHHHYSLCHTYLMLLHDCVQVSQHYLPKNSQTMYKYASSCWFQPIWKNISQIGSFPQIGVKITNSWNYYPVFLQQSWFSETCPFGDLHVYWRKKHIVYVYMAISENGDTPKSSILIGFSIINHPFWGTPILGNPHIYSSSSQVCFELRRVNV